MDDFKARLQLEYDELKEKYFKLTNFLATEGFSALSHHQQFLLTTQASIMDSYRRILKERINDLNHKK